MSARDESWPSVPPRPAMPPNIIVKSESWSSALLALVCLVGICAAIAIALGVV